MNRDETVSGVDPSLIVRVVFSLKGWVSSVDYPREMLGQKSVGVMISANRRKDSSL